MREEYENQIELEKWIEEKSKMPIHTDEKGNLAFICFDLCIEHHAAITTLFNVGLYGSMYSLIRSSFESYIRGMFLLNAATQTEIEQYITDNFNLKFNQLIERVESSLGSEKGQLSKLKESAWGTFNSFTHTGIEQAIRRNKNGAVGAIAYPEKEIVNILNLAGTFSLLATVAIAGMSKSESFVEEALKKCKEYAI
jgi:hypothetical protein